MKLPLFPGFSAFTAESSCILMSAAADPLSCWTRLSTFTAEFSCILMTTRADPAFFYRFGLSALAAEFSCILMATRTDPTRFYWFFLLRSVFFCFLLRCLLQISGRHGRRHIAAHLSAHIHPHKAYSASSRILSGSLHASGKRPPCT